MKRSTIHVLLADDDLDDCVLFQDALNDLRIAASLSVVHNGEQLMEKILGDKEVPDVLFLDLNMPRKNGLECLTELMAREQTKRVPVLIFSTSFNPDTIKLLHAKGARYYIRKPDEFESLKWVIDKGIRLAQNNGGVTLSEFVLKPDNHN